MKFKLDENLGRAAAAVLLEAGFDVLTISDQPMEGGVGPKRKTDDALGKDGQDPKSDWAPETTRTHPVACSVYWRGWRRVI